ncbi:GGDEF domain-containing protein [Candidatus Uhrbacteria bacterium]|nr:GGDEF domain-containing protein [Candidatus Uhrbacteria bacterium]
MREAGELQQLRARIERLEGELEQALSAVVDRDRDLISMKHKLDKARVDFLTKLHTRVVFEERLAAQVAECLRDGTYMTVMMVDLGGLGDVNKEYGHIPGGDRMLVRLAKILEDSIRGSDTVARVSAEDDGVAGDARDETLVRWGGDEYGLLLRHADETVAAAVIGRVRRAVEDAFVRVGKGRGTLIPLKASIGVAVGCGDQLTEDIREVADAALGEAKEARKSADECFSYEMRVMG